MQREGAVWNWISLAPPISVLSELDQNDMPPMQADRRLQQQSGCSYGGVGTWTRY